MTATSAAPLIDIEAERQRRKQELAQGYRLFAALRWGDLGDGHITARDPEHTDSMWLLRVGVGFESATVDDLVLVGPDGTARDGSAINNTAYYIHHPIHTARPDVVAVAHTHTAWATPFCATRRTIEPITQEACSFFERWSSFDDEEVQVLGTAGGVRIAAALGQNWTVLLRNHGPLTVGTSVADAVGAFVTLDRVAEVAMKTPDAVPISAESARIARDDLLAHNAFESGFAYLVKRHLGE